MYTPASLGLISRSAVRPSVTAGLKWAPEMTASVWIRKNRRNTWTSPITEKSMNGWIAGAPRPGETGGGTYSEIAAVMKKTNAKVPMNSPM